MDILYITCRIFTRIFPRVLGRTFTRILGRVSPRIPYYQNARVFTLKFPRVLGRILGRVFVHGCFTITSLIIKHQKVSQIILFQLNDFLIQLGILNNQLTIHLTQLLIVLEVNEPCCQISNKNNKQHIEISLFHSDFSYQLMGST